MTDPFAPIPDQPSAFRFTDYSFYLEDQEGLGSIQEILVQRDELFAALAVEGKSSLAPRSTLLAQLLAIRTISTLAEEHDGKILDDFRIALCEMVMQMQVSMLEFIWHVVDKDPKKFVSTATRFQIYLSEANRQGLGYYLERLAKGKEG